MKLEREALMHYLDASFKKDTGNSRVGGSR